jgi:biopolymer transport protein ExbD
MKKIFLAVTCIMLLSSSCDHNLFVGEGELISKELVIDDFNQIISSGSFNVTVTKGDLQKVTVTGYSNIINQLETVVTNEKWKIELENGRYKNADLTINIVIPMLNYAALEGSGELIINDFKSNENLSINLSGSGIIELNANEGCKNLNLKIDGSGNIYVEKEFIDLENLTLQIIGSGNYDGFVNKTNTCNLKIEGSGKCNVFAFNEIIAKINGAGVVNYKGNPTINSKITGSGKINNKN